MNDFVTFDLALADAEDHTSICQIAIVKYSNFEIEDQHVAFVYPGTDYFTNTHIHSIDYEMVKDAPHFLDVFQKIREMANNTIVLHHMPFNKSALKLTCEKYKVKPLNHDLWLDTEKIAQRIFGQIDKEYYELEDLARSLNIEFDFYHNALDGAIATGKVAQFFHEYTGYHMKYWFYLFYSHMNVCKNTPASLFSLRKCGYQS